jgi:hypothetical protein
VRSPFSLTKFILLLFIPLFIFFFFREFPYGAFLEPGSTAYLLYSGYLADVLQPFGLYFGLCLIEPWLVWMKLWWVKTLLVVLLPVLLEILQGVRLYKLPGSTFDPFDLLAYACGGLLAALVERRLLSRFGFWKVPFRD